MVNFKKGRTPKIERVGEIYINNQGCELEIIEYFNSRNCTIKFEGGVILKNIVYCNIKSGEVLNPFYGSVHSVGYLGCLDYKKLISENKIAYRVWVDVIKRGFCDKFKNKRPTYKDVTVCEEWHNFQNFAEWFRKNYTEGWELDKDIICSDCKIYSPETCCFVPHEINMLFIKTDIKDLPQGITQRSCCEGFYVYYSVEVNNRKFIGFFKNLKEAIETYNLTKEKRIKEVAHKYKDRLSLKVYEILINYKIENSGK